MTGYDKSPDYGDRKPSWPGVILLAVVLIGGVVVLWWVLSG